jgi:hypothetical protein
MLADVDSGVGCCLLARRSDDAARRTSHMKQNLCGVRGFAISTAVFLQTDVSEERVASILRVDEITRHSRASRAVRNGGDSLLDHTPTSASSPKGSAGVLTRTETEGNCDCNPPRTHPGTAKPLAPTGRHSSAVTCVTSRQGACDCSLKDAVGS